MFLALKVLLLASLIKLLVHIEKPIVCAAIYAATGLLLPFMVPIDLVEVVCRVGVSFVLGLAFFWGLSRVEPLGLWWFLMIPVGIVGIFVTDLALFG